MFLDREPYIRYWRPFYFRFGTVIRRIKGVVILAGGRGGGQPADDKRPPTSITEQLLRIERQLAALEQSQQQFCSAIEQVLCAAIADRQLNVAVQTVQDATRNAEQRILGTIIAGNAELKENDAAQWAALEHLLFALAGGSIRLSLVAESISHSGRFQTAQQAGNGAS